MQLRIVAVGKIREKYVASACEDFARRLRPYYPIEVVEVKASQAAHPAAAMRDEAQRIVKLLHEDDLIWLLDRAGTQLSSQELSQMLHDVGSAGTRRMTFIIAGTYGADEALRRRGRFVWSLSTLTFLHEWARMIVLEQLYRAAKIARNEPYHH